MLNINTLWSDGKRNYDYEVEGASRRGWRVNQGKPFRVYHRDGSSSLAYQFGEKHFTYSQEELVEVKAAYQAERAAIHEHNELVKRLAAMDTETLRRLVAMVEG